MNLFVTGATGFIGSNFVNSSLKKGFNVFGLKQKNSKSRIELEKEPQWVIGDLEGDYTAELKKTNILVHFAAHSPNVPYDSLENCIRWNVNATLKLFNQALKSGVKEFLVAGSSFEYGESAMDYDEIPANAPLMPIENYPVSKAMASIMLRSWAIKNNVKLKILRIFNVYGEGEKETRLWPSLKKAALAGNDFQMTEGKQIRNFIHVKDLVEIFINELNFENVKKQNPMIINVGSHENQSVLEFSKFWWNTFQARGKLVIGSLPYRENEIMQYIPKL